MKRILLTPLLLFFTFAVAIKVGAQCPSLPSPDFPLNNFDISNGTITGDVLSFTNIGSFNGQVVDLRVTLVDANTANNLSGLDIQWELDTAGFFLRHATDGDYVDFDFFITGTNTPIQVEFAVFVDDFDIGEAFVVASNLVLGYQGDSGNPYIINDNGTTLYAESNRDLPPLDRLILYLDMISSFRMTFRVTNPTLPTATARDYGFRGSGSIDNPFCEFDECNIISGNPDTDGDGVTDICDLDDDNDGIPDSLDGGCTEVELLALNGIDGDFEALAGVAGTGGIINSDVSSSGGWSQGDGSADSYLPPITGAGVAEGTPASPQGGVFAGGFSNTDPGVFIKGGESFYADIPNLTVGENYTVNFYQSNPGWHTVPTNIVAPGDWHGRWRVDFGTEVQFSNEMVFDGYGNQTWEAVSMNFTATATTQRIEFIVNTGPSATEPENSFPGQFDDGIFSYMGIDGIEILEVQCIDTDGDGIPDHLDLDSDNDGCFDALEAGHGETVDASGKVDGPFGINGLDNDLESDDTFEATPNYSLAESGGVPNFQNNNINIVCCGDTDSDDDGLGDLCDLDDDNDGIPDIDESNFICLNATSVTVLTPTVANNAQAVGSVVPEGSAASSSNSATVRTGAVLVLTLDQELPVGAVVNIHAADVRSDNSGSIDITDEGTGQLSISPSDWTTDDVIHVFELVITVPTDEITFTGGSGAGVFIDGIESCIIEDLDADGDGIPNRLDLDSDGDGCFDAVEAGHNEAVDAEGVVDGPFGNNGLDNDVEDVDADTAMINYTLTETVTGTPDFLNGGQRAPACCGPLDSDGDGWGDICDLDDDNDGIPDVDECSGEFLASISLTNSGTVVNPVEAVGLPDGTSARLESGGVIVLELESILNTGDELSIFIARVNLGGRLIVGAGTSAAGPFTDEIVYDDFGTVGLIEEQIYTVSSDNVTHIQLRRTNGRVLIDGVQTFDINCDTDGDGIPNRLDLDSDDDGCFDAVEAGHNEVVDAEGEVDGPFGNNGLDNDVEDVDDNSAMINYTLTETVTGTPDFLNGSQRAPACCGPLDSDGDGWGDLCDLDDDNDGILDIDETNFICLNATSVTVLTPTVANSVRAVGSVIPEGSVADNSNSAIVRTGAVLLLTLGQELPVGSTVNIHAADVRTDLSGSIDITDEGTGLLSIMPSDWVTDDIIQVFTLTITAPTDEITLTGVSGSGVYIDGIESCIENDIDTDGDGTPDRLDLDSDGDGCFDALEAGHGEAVDSNGLVDGPFGNNGFDADLENNDTDTATANYTLAETVPGTPDFLNDTINTACCTVTGDVPEFQNGILIACHGGTADLTSLINGDTSIPTGATIRWFTSNNSSGTEVADATMVGVGTYFAFYYNTLNNCFSDNSDEVSVTQPASPLSTVVDNITMPSCAGRGDGAIDITVTGGTPLYTYLWSNAATTEDLSAVTEGTYHVTVTDNNGCAFTLSNIVVTAPSTTTLGIQVILEGAYDTATQSMTTHLNDLHLLPGQEFLQSGVTVPGRVVPNTPVGQPYSVPAWNYAGVEGDQIGDPSLDPLRIGYSASTVDWILVSIRQGSFQPSSEVWRCAGLLQSDGSIEYPDECACLMLNGSTDDFYVVVEHRNHLPIMSEAITISGDMLSFDFTSNDSWRANSTFGLIGVGQKNINGTYVMLAGNVNTSTFVDQSNIDSRDRTSLSNESGKEYEYIDGDVNMDGLLDLMDRTFFDQNFNRTTYIPF